jgi:hypothetical protein
MSACSWRFFYLSWRFLAIRKNPGSDSTASSLYVPWCRMASYQSQLWRRHVLSENMEMKIQELHIISCTEYKRIYGYWRNKYTNLAQCA